MSGHGRTLGGGSEVPRRGHGLPTRIDGFQAPLQALETGFRAQPTSETAWRAARVEVCGQVAVTLQPHGWRQPRV